MDYSRTIKLKKKQVLPNLLVFDKIDYYKTLGKIFHIFQL